ISIGIESMSRAGSQRFDGKNRIKGKLNYETGKKFQSKPKSSESLYPLSNPMHFLKKNRSENSLVFAVNMVLIYWYTTERRRLFFKRNNLYLIPKAST
ncbi:MAG: hypothetical protein ABI290_02640, partial [Ginsengibacter sp.]